MTNKPSVIVSAVALVFLVATPVAAAERQQLTGHVPEAVARLHLQPIGRLPATNQLALTIGLPLRNQAGLSDFIKQLYDPSSTNFHRYLTTDQFTERYGPTEKEYQAILDFAKTNGFVVTGTFTHRTLVNVSATVSNIEKALSFRLLVYRHPTEQREFYAPDVEPSVDSALPILSVSGLNNFARGHGLHLKSAGMPVAPGKGTGPGGNSYRGYDFRNAYAPHVSLNGTGQNVGLVELDGYYSSDIATYESQAGLPNVAISNVLNGVSGVPDNNTNFVAECSLDIEMVIAMAPGLSRLYVFEGNNFDSILGVIVTNTQIKQFSSSWFGFGFDASGDQSLQQLAAQGQTFFQASGDGDAYTQTITGPADDPYVSSCGGTELTMDATASNYVSEAVWNSGYQVPGWGENGGYGPTNGGYWGSGGGVSSTYSIPFWQQGVNLAPLGGSTSKRNIPDVALTGDGVWCNYFNGLSGVFEGTSIAAPLWAGFCALANQQAASESVPSVGFLNPAFYSIGQSALYTNCFNDITNGNDYWPDSPSEFNSAVGYDLCSGWGTPKGTNLINTLVHFGGYTSTNITVWVDYNYTGSTQNGTCNAPYKTFAQAVAAVPSGGQIWFRTAGSKVEIMTRVQADAH